MNCKLIGLGGVILLALLVMACGGGSDSTKTVGPTGTQTSSTNGGGNTAAATQTAKASATQANATSASGAGACALLTTDEVAVAINDTVDDGIQTQSEASTSECNWNSTNLVTAVYLTLYAGVDSQAAEAKFNIAAGTLTEVSGLGDKAHWDRITDTLKVLEVLKGANEVSIQVVDFKAGADPESEAKTLAQKALARLP